ncbi:hypothetical protein L6452_05141 [Arctium lappa]|uniref:Uncharacterized protein n=1 Tax=Arctium lappa TaxID=4217 RepID=A0ACB9EF56_ARCLA|nr:hypothetical protein L6452_05141 [Arctium lappa]
MYVESMRRLWLWGGRGEFYPERHGMADCAYYNGTGTCGYASKCRYNHPPDRSSSDPRSKKYRPAEGIVNRKIKLDTCDDDASRNGSHLKKITFGTVKGDLRYFSTMSRLFITIPLALDLSTTKQLVAQSQMIDFLANLRTKIQNTNILRTKVLRTLSPVHQNPSQPGRLQIIAGEKDGRNHLTFAKRVRLHHSHNHCLWYKVYYPKLYATEADSKDYKIFNCIQRGHQNSLERLPLFFVLMILGGLKHQNLGCASTLLLSLLLLIQRGPKVQQKLVVRPYEAKPYECPDAKPMKVSKLVCHEAVAVATAYRRSGSGEGNDADRGSIRDEGSKSDRGVDILLYTRLNPKRNLVEREGQRIEKTEEVVGCGGLGTEKVYRRLSNLAGGREIRKRDVGRDCVLGQSRWRWSRRLGFEIEGFKNQHSLVRMIMGAIHLIVVVGYGQEVLQDTVWFGAAAVSLDSLAVFLLLISVLTAHFGSCRLREHPLASLGGCIRFDSFVILSLRWFDPRKLRLFLDPFC